jgi:hypothetical protein
MDKRSSTDARDFDYSRDSMFSIHIAMINSNRFSHSYGFALAKRNWVTIRRHSGASNKVMFS